MTPRNYTDEELIREIERCYTDECVIELLRRFRQRKDGEWDDDVAA